MQIYPQQVQDTELSLVVPIPQAPLIQIVQPIVDQTEIAMQNIQIEDHVQFEHVFSKTNNYCTGRVTEKSIFNVPGLGTLSTGHSFDPKQCQCCEPEPEIGPCQCYKCDQHAFSLPDYTMDNELIHIEYWEGGVGLINVKGLPVLKFRNSKPNKCDYANAHCKSGYPKMKIFSLQDEKKPCLLLRPEPSPCPENTLAVYGCCAQYGLCTSSRKFYVEGLTQGTCSITNTRTCREAFAKIYLLQGKMCQPDLDYPKFIVQFDNVTQIDKLAVLMGLIHYNIFKKWYVIVSVRYRLMGMA